MELCVGGGPFRYGGALAVGEEGGVGGDVGDYGVDRGGGVGEGAVRGEAVGLFEGDEGKEGSALVEEGRRGWFAEERPEGFGRHCVLRKGTVV